MQTTNDKQRAVLELMKQTRKAMEDAWQAAMNPLIDVGQEIVMLGERIDRIEAEMNAQEGGK